MINTHKCLDKHGNFYVLGYDQGYFYLDKYASKEDYKVLAPVSSRKYTMAEHSFDALLKELEV